MKLLISILSYLCCYVSLANPTVFKYDEFGNLACEYVKFDAFYKTPDAVGNLYKSRDQDDRKYGKGGKLLQDDKYFYHYDEEGNLILKSTRDITKPLELPKATNFIDRLFGHTEEQKDEIVNHQNWQQGDTAYSWLANGMLDSVTKEDGTTVKFEYDALGRRTAKLVIPHLGVRGLIHRYFWDGNVLLHEWHYELKQRPKLVLDNNGELVYNTKEPITNLVTWVYEEGSFVPCAKIVANETFSIINDYIGRPIQAYNDKGNLIWETDYDIYGQLRNLRGERSFIPFRQLGQYEDVETGLYYNRFRYYNPDSGLYISQDPIGLKGGNPNFYAYVRDSNSWIDPFGLDPLGTGGYSVYALYDKGATDPYYIGITKQDVQTRMDQHMDTGRYGDNTVHKVLHDDLTIEQARGQEQFLIEKHKTKTGIIGEDISATNRGNKINSFDKTRTDARGKAFKAEYDKLKKGCK